jgi:hypothetical protein
MVALNDDLERETGEESCLDAAYVIGLILRLLNPPECRVTPTSASTQPGAMAEDGPDDGRAGGVESVDDDGEKDSEQARFRTSHGAVGSSV